MTAATKYLTQYHGIDVEGNWLKKIDKVLMAKEPTSENISCAAYD